MATRFRSYGLLDCRSPVEWSHPLNRGLVGEWAVTSLSGWRGASVARNLVRGGKIPYDGTFNSTGVTWQGLTSPGGYGSLKFGGGASDNITLWSSSVLPISGTKASACCWIYPTGSLTAYQTVFDWGGSSITRNLSAFLGGVASHLFVAFADTSGAELSSSTDAWVANLWQHLCVTCDGSTITAYRNGNFFALSGTGIGAGMTLQPFLWGGNPSDVGAAFTGYQDDLIVANRCWSANEVAALYLESRQGNPNRWRWVRGTVYSFPGTTPAGARVNVAAYMKRSVRISPSLGATR